MSAGEKTSHPSSVAGHKEKGIPFGPYPFVRNERRAEG